MVYCMVAWCPVWLTVAWCLVSWMVALMVGGGVGTSVMADGDNVSGVMWCVGGECLVSYTHLTLPTRSTV